MIGRGSPQALFAATVGMVVLVAASGAAQDPPEPPKATASVSPPAVAVGDMVEYTLRISAAGNVNIQLVAGPNFSAFERLRSTRGTEFRSVNGRAALTYTYTYGLRARRAGKHRIGGAIADVGGTRISPKPVEITVVARGEEPPKVEGDRGAAWVYGAVTNRKPYVGEQVLLEYSLMLDEARVGSFGVEVNDLKDPSFDGFWVEELSDKVDGRVRRREFDKKTYAARPLQLEALFPLRAGPQTIDPLTMDISVSARVGFGRRRQKIASDPIEIEVRALPAGAPAGFDRSNVGQYRLEVTVDKSRVRVGEPLTVRVTVRGRGMVSRVEVPTLLESPKYRLLPPVYDKKTEVLRDRRVGGYKTAEIVVTPLEEGVVTIPGLRFVFFDPAREEYVTVVSKPKTVRVAGEVVGGARQEQELVEREGREEPKAVSRAKQPLRELRAVEDAGSVPAQRPGVPFWVGVAVPPMAWFLFLGWGGWRVRRERSAPERIRQSAAAQAREALTVAGDEPGAVLNRYLALRLDVPPGSVAGPGLRSLLSQRDVPGEIVDQVMSVQTQCDQARFTGQGSAGLADVVLGSIDAVEGAL